MTKCDKMHQIYQNVSKCIKVWHSAAKCDKMYQKCICGSWKPHAQIEIKCITGLQRLAPARMTCTHLKIFWLLAQEKYRFGRFARFPFFNLRLWAQEAEFGLTSFSPWIAVGNLPKPDEGNLPTRRWTGWLRWSDGQDLHHRQRGPKDSEGWKK